MQFRKLQSTAGGASYTLSLPKEWVEYQKLKKGQQLAMEERNDGAIVVYPLPLKREEVSEYVIKRGGKAIDEVFRMAIGGYVNGVDTILLEGDFPWEDEKRLLEWVQGFLIGATMCREEGGLRISISIDEEDMPPQKVIRRAHNIAHWMFTEAAGEIIRISGGVFGGSQLLEDIIMRDREVDRLHVVCQRGLNKAILDTDFRARIGMERGDMSDYFRTMDYVELMADFSYELAKRGRALAKHKLSKVEISKFVALSSKVGKLHKSAMRAFFRKDRALSNEMIASAVRLKQRDIPNAMAELVVRQRNKEAAAVLSDSLNLMISLVDTIKHISELNIDRCIRYSGRQLPSAPRQGKASRRQQ